MGWFTKKKSAISSSSAGAASSARHITQNALAYAGREKLDFRAPYVFHNIINSRGEELIKNKTFSQLSHPQRFNNGCYNIGFYQIAEGKEYQMPPDSTYQRQPWTVGIAYNEFNSIRWIRDSETIAHWGIYIRSHGNEVRHTHAHIFTTRTEILNRYIGCPEPDIRHELGRRSW
jgi:hypothetical protein